MTEPSRIRDARRECEEYGTFRGVAMRGSWHRARRLNSVRALCPMRRTARSPGAQPRLLTRPHGAIVSGYMISRRGFLGGSIALLAAPLGVEAQQPAGRRTIGFLGASTPSDMGPWVAAFLQRLHELGWTEGRNVAV